MIDATFATDQVQYALEDAEILRRCQRYLGHRRWAHSLVPDFRFLWRQLIKIMGVNDPPVKTPRCQRKSRPGGVGLPSGAGRWTIEDTMQAMNLAWGRVREPGML